MEKKRKLFPFLDLRKKKISNEKNGFVRRGISLHPFMFITYSKGRQDEMKLVGCIIRNTRLLGKFCPKVV